MRKFSQIIPLGLALLVLGLAGCKTESKSPDFKSTSTGPFLQVYQARGVVRELPADGRSAVIQHEAVPGYMPAMTMSFDVRDTNELAGLQVGDAVTFQLVVGEKDGWMQHVKKVGAAPLPTPTGQLPPSLHIVRDVEPLAVGDLLPDYHFTNELGAPVHLGQYRGQVLALTFIFTRCPYPTYCPQMSRGFMDVAAKLKTQPGAPKQWHLFSISFDPEYDTPAQLKTYAGAFAYDPRQWSFLTGAVVDIYAITEQFGVQFWRPDATAPINHNLRTVVVDATGHILKIIPGNKWTSDELVAEMVAAGK